MVASNSKGWEDDGEGSGSNWSVRRQGRSGMLQVG